MREWILGAVLAIAGVLAVGGVSMFSQRVGLIVAGVLLAVWAWLMLGEVDG